MTTYHTTTVDGLEVFYRQAGDPASPAVLLLHGFPTSSHMFRDLIPALAGSYRIVAPDLPGFGFTDAPDRARFTYSFDHLAEVVERFTETIGLDRYALYVFDYGAPVGLRLALRHPERVTALISQNGNAYEEGLSTGWNPIQRYWQDPTPENRTALRDFLKSDATKAQYGYGVKAPARLAPEAWTLDSALLSRPGNDEIQLDLFLDYRTNIALYPAFQQYFRTRRPPTLAVWGKDDPFFLPQGAEAFKRDNPDAEVRFFDTGHFALETHAQEIGAAIKEFLGRMLGEVQTMKPSPVDLVRSFYARLAQGDVPGLVGLLAADLEWTEAERFPYYGGTWRTPQAVVGGLLAPLGKDWSAFAATPERFLADGDEVVALGAYHGTHRETHRSFTATFAHVWRVRDHRLSGFTQYTDTAKVLEATSHPRPETDPLAAVR